MVVLNKRVKIILAVLIFAVLVLAGTVIERYEKDAFILETVATDDADYVPTSQSVIDGRININSAEVEELTELNGIGEALAQRIINYRTENGPFVTIEEIMKVPGISEKKFEVLRDDICAE